MLVDGLQGDDNYRSGRYIGLYGQNFDAIIDLQETKEISSVSLGTYLVPGDYIFGLTGLEIYGSNDGSAYSKDCLEDHTGTGKRQQEQCTET